MRKAGRERTEKGRQEEKTGTLVSAKYTGRETCPGKEVGYIMYKLVIFDLDGTLLNTIGDLAAAGNHTLAEMGFPQHPEESFKHFVGNGIPKLIERMLPPGHDKPTEERAYAMFTEYYSQHKSDLTKPYPGMRELVRELREKGVVCGCNSNKAHEFSAELVRQNYGGDIAEVIGFGAGFQPKPDPGAALELIRRAGVDPQEALYVGDSDVDIMTGHNAGIDVCAALWGFRSYEELAAREPTYFAHDAEELKKIVLG
ncbi:MAG: HAD-IA family hydrolase [Oscillospiraceae bacterium]|nr:HAD-IA family hydrolase [Oscillospiraceae bacterium]